MLWGPLRHTRPWYLCKHCLVLQRRPGLLFFSCPAFLVRVHNSGTMASGSSTLQPASSALVLLFPPHAPHGAPYDLERRAKAAGGPPQTPNAAWSRPPPHFLHKSTTTRRNRVSSVLVTVWTSVGGCRVSQECPDTTSEPAWLGPLRRLRGEGGLLPVSPHTMGYKFSSDWVWSQNTPRSWYWHFMGPQKP